MTTGYEHYSSCGRYATIRSCIAYQMVRSRTVERSRAAPGGMHMLMSFVGCISVLMMGTGLEDLLGCAFAGVQNMMNGKSKRLDEVHYRGITVVDFLAELEKAKKLPTGRLWGGGGFAW